MMGKEKVEELFSMVMPQQNAQSFVGQIFKVYDKDGNSNLDFKVLFEESVNKSLSVFLGVHAFIRFNCFCNH